MSTIYQLLMNEHIIQCKMNYISITETQVFHIIFHALPSLLTA